MAITPILFPYTTVSPHLQDAALQFFASLTLIQPLEDHTEGRADAGNREDIIVRVPTQDRRAELENLIKAYHLWAQQHPATDLSAWAGRGETVPFFDETAVARIRSQIRRGDSPPPAADPLFDCRLFLGIAQEFDRQMAETARGLENLGAAEARMMRELKGETATESAKTEGSVPPAASLAYMMPRRIKAWTGLYLSAPLRHGIFITPVPDVIDHLTEIGDPGRIHHVGTFAPPESRDVLNRQLESAAGTSWPRKGLNLSISGQEAPSGTGDPQLEIYMVPNETPEEFFASFSPPGIKPSLVEGQFRHTLMGILVL